MVHALYKAYWVLNEDVDDPRVLQKYARRFGVTWADVTTAATKQRLSAHTREAAEAGAFGVPFFIVKGTYWN